MLIPEVVIFSTRAPVRGRASARMSATRATFRKMKIKVGIIGGAGYTGGELIRLLIHHPHVSISFIHSRNNAGKAVESVHQDLIGETDLNFTDKLKNDVDVLFLCLGHGESKSFLEENKIADKIRIIGHP